MEKMGPDDFYMVKKIIEPHYESLEVAQALAYLRLTGWDATIFWGCFPTLNAKLAEAEPALRREARAAVYQVWNNYYHIGEELDLPFYLGLVLFKLGLHLEALEFFGHSLELYGRSASTLFNMAVCYYSLGQPGQAVAYASQALEVTPDFEPAQKMRDKLSPAAQ
jgi:tetratricopeptide (TPR) repeat protein